MKSIKEWLEEQRINEDLGTKTQFRAVMGGPQVEVDTKLKSMLKTKIEQIVREAEKEENKSKSELLRSIIAVVESLLADMSGTRLSSDKLFDKLNANEQE